MCFLWNQDCKSTWFVSLFNRMYISLSVFLSVIETLFFRLHPQSGVVDFTPAASGAALPLCSHSSSALCWTPALQVCTYSTPCTLVLKCWHVTLKWYFPPKMKIVTYLASSNSKPVWISLLCWTQRKIFWRKFVSRLFWDTIDFHSRKKNTMEVNGAPELLCFPHSSEYLPLCSAEQRHSYSFGTTWGRVNDDFLGELSL